MTQPHLLGIFIELPKLSLNEYYLLSLRGFPCSDWISACIVFVVGFIPGRISFFEEWNLTTVNDSLFIANTEKTFSPDMFSNLVNSRTNYGDLFESEKQVLMLALSRGRWAAPQKRVMIHLLCQPTADAWRCQESQSKDSKHISSFDGTSRATSRFRLCSYYTGKLFVPTSDM